MGKIYLSDKINSLKCRNVVEVVRQLINNPSINPPGKEAEVADYIKQHMEYFGIEINIQEVEMGRYNVISRLKGQGKRKPIIFTGHMDVVPVSTEEEKKWDTNPFEGTIQDDFLYGRGAADMKGGLGAAMVAMALLAEEKIELPGDVILVATIDEEDVMRGSKALINSTLVSDAEAIVVCEPTDMEVVLDCRGRTWADIHVKGQSAHASKQGAGINAIDHANAIMNKMETYLVSYQPHELLGDFFWQTTVIKGGVEPAIVPDECILTVDCRLVPGQMPKDVWQSMTDLIEGLKEEIPELQAEIEIIEEREPWSTEPESNISQLIQRAYGLLDMPYKRGGFLGTTDGTVLRRMGMDAVIVGPGHMDNVHKQNEWVSIRQLEEATKLYATIMLLED